MFARVTTVQVKIDKLDEAAKLYEDRAVPAAKSQKGYQGIYLLSDRKTGKSLSISVWDGEVGNGQSSMMKCAGWRGSAVSKVWAMRS